MEATYNTVTYKQGRGLGGFLFMLFLLIVVGGMALYLLGANKVSHADKHKEEAVITQNCIDKNGADIIYEKSEDRKVQLCFIDLNKDGTFKGLGIRVLEKIKGEWQELTAYIEENITTVEQAIGYADVDKGKYGMINFVKDSWKGFIY